jgi:hypothetical protein
LKEAQTLEFWSLFPKFEKTLKNDVALIVFLGFFRKWFGMLLEHYFGTKRWEKPINLIIRAPSSRFENPSTP